MNLITPDGGLLFWMVLIFALVFFLLWKFGFPIITDMVEKRSERISSSLKLAKEAEERMAKLSAEQQALIRKTRSEQTALIKEAVRNKDEIIELAKIQAQQEAAKMIEQAREEIAQEKEAALKEIRSEVALLSVRIAEKILRGELSDANKQNEYLDKLIDEHRDYC